MTDLPAHEQQRFASSPLVTGEPHLRFHAGGLPKTSDGYRTDWVTDGAKALALLAEEDFDAVFSDVMMPGMSGIELGEKLAELHPALPVLLTSGYSEVLARNTDHGFALLHKPYSMDDPARARRKVARIKHVER